MQVKIENAQNYYGGLSDNFPPNLIHFRMDRETPFYDNNDYAYDFNEHGAYQTFPKPFEFRPSEYELNRQQRLQLKGWFRPKIKRPSVQLMRLAEDIFSTGLIDPRGARDGDVWPVRFVSKWELHVIKLPLVSLGEAETKILLCIGSHFQVSVDKLNAHHVG